MSKIEITSNNLSKFGKRLQNILNVKLKYEINLTSALEILAQTLGAKNLHELQEKIKQESPTNQPITSETKIANELSLIAGNYKYIHLPVYLMLSQNEVKKIEEKILNTKDSSISVNISEVEIKAILGLDSVEEAVELEVYKNDFAIKGVISIGDMCGFINASYHGDRISNYLIILDVIEGKLLDFKNEEKMMKKPKAKIKKNI